MGKKKRPSALLQGQQKLKFNVKVREPARTAAPSTPPRAAPSSPHPMAGPSRPLPPAPLELAGHALDRPRQTVRPLVHGGPGKSARAAPSIPPRAAPSTPPSMAGPSSRPLPPDQGRGEPAGRALGRPRRVCAIRLSQPLESPDTSSDEDLGDAWSPTKNAEGE